MGWITPYFSPRVQVLSRHILAIAAVFHGHLHPAFIRAASPIDANDRRMKGKPGTGRETCVIPEAGIALSGNGLLGAIAPDAHSLRNQSKHPKAALSSNKSIYKTIDKGAGFPYNTYMVKQWC